MYQNIAKYLSLSFWFKNPGPASTFEIVFWTALFSFLLFLALVVYLYTKSSLKNFPPKQKLLGPVITIFALFGFSGGLFLILRTLSPNFLGVRALPLVVWLIGSALGLFFIFKYLKKSPLEALKFETRVLKERYFKKSKA